MHEESQPHEGKRKDLFWFVVWFFYFIVCREDVSKKTLGED